VAVTAERLTKVARLAVLIPCFNEERTIGDVVTDFRSALPSADVYVFDNNSTDRSAVCAREAGARVVAESRQGKGYVLRSMFDTVDAEVYVLVDGDRTYPADAVHALIGPVLDGHADMVIGSRLHPLAASEFTALHWWGNRLYVRLLRLLFGIALTDLLSGYRAMSRTVVQTVRLTSDGFEVDTELTIKVIRAGFRVVDTPVNLSRRPTGSHSKIRLVRDGVAILAEMVALYRREAPIAFAWWTALALVGLTIALLLVRPQLAQIIVAGVTAVLVVGTLRAVGRRR
jgi:glycosyltransferase involved in cell wall biosynthesis